MKRISLLALSSTVAMAQTPAVAEAAAAPVYAPAAEAASAPLAPIHDDLIYGNPALPRSIGYLMITPSDYYMKREAAFQWNGSSATTFNGAGLAVIDQYFAGFSTKGGQGELGAGYITSQFGAGLRFNLDKRGYSDDNPANNEVAEYDSTLQPTSIGLFGSVPMNDMTVYGSFDWGTPVTFGSRTVQTANGKVTQASRSDSYTLGLGALSAANGDRGISWGLSLKLANAAYRRVGQSSDDASSDYLIQEMGSVGKTFSKSGFILAAGFNEMLDYYNGKGDFDAPDWGYQVTLQPTLATILPVFEHWSVKGGAGLAFAYSDEDNQVGKDAQTSSRLWTAVPDAKVGVRYERGRWAAEAQVVNAFLSHGPYFISGANGATTANPGGNNMFGSFAVTANFK